MNSKLSICIPTYNRFEYLKDQIEHLIPFVTRYEIPIYIADNGSDDATYQVVMKLKSQYQYIFYHRNTFNLGADRNFQKVLQMPSSRYMWLLGDDDRIMMEKLDNILNVLDDDYDLLVLNGSNRVKKNSSKVYTECNLILKEIGWHMTWMSCLVFSKEMIKKMDFEKYYDTSLIHFGAIFDYFGKQKMINVYWNSETFIVPSYIRYFDRTGGWHESTFLIFSKKWCDVIDSFSETYTRSAKNKCIMNHGIRSDLFSLKNLLKLRCKNIYNKKILRQYEPYLLRSIRFPFAVLWIIAYIPDQICDFAMSIHKFIKTKIIFR